MTIARIYDFFVKDRSVYCADKTLKTYDCHIQLFLRFLGERYRSVDHLTFAELPEEDNIYSDYILYLRGRVKNSTIRSYCRSIRAFLRWAYSEDHCRDYLKKVKLPKDDAVPKQPLYADEVAAIDGTFDLRTKRGLRNYCIVHLMLDCGLRCSEVVGLRIEDLDFKRNLISIEISKGMKSRITLIPDFLLERIRDYLQMDDGDRQSGSVFYSLRSGSPITRNTVKQLFEHLKTESGVQRVHAHLLRHTFATSYLIGGGNLEFLRVFLGHCDYDVTKEYSQLAARCRMLGVDVYRLDSIFSLKDTKIVNQVL